MIGVPYDTLSTILYNIGYLREVINPDLAFFSHFAPHPGTPIYYEAVSKSIIPPYKEWEKLESDPVFREVPPPYEPSANPYLQWKRIPSTSH